jgi:hypothetical protein
LLVKSAFDTVVNPQACVNNVALMQLLRIAGETPIREISPDAVKQFWSKMFWNGIFVLIPLYVTTPVIAICIYVLIRLGMMYHHSWTAPI